MTREVCELFDVESGGNFVDCTVGLGGHAEAILSANPKSTLLGLDRDSSALDIAKKRLSHFGERVSFLKCNFKDVDFWKKELKNAPTGILVDLGISSLQLEEGRGFSFKDSLSLDMRMDRSQGMTALEFVNKANQDEIASVLKEFGEVENSRKLAKEIVEYRKTKAIESGEELGRIVERCSPKGKRDKIHPATKVFQALRIFLNEEICNLDSFLKEAVKLLASSGKIIVISYHSLEDRIVKKTFAELKKGCICPPRLPICGCGLKPLFSHISKNPLRPSLEEVLRNNSSRSAKLRYGVKV
jgi:16S rRNA (cytosine1402-N4)-methyltransferase